MASKMAAAPLYPVWLHLDLSWSDEFGVFTYVFEVKESIEIIFRVKEVAGNGEFQDGRQSYSIYHTIFNLRPEPTRRNI